MKKNSVYVDSKLLDMKPGAKSRITRPAEKMENRHDWHAGRIPGLLFLIDISCYAAAAST